MSQAEQDSDARATDWGIAALALYTEMVRTLPTLDCNIGHNEAAQTGKPPLVTFLHGGGPIVPATRGGGGAPARQPWERRCALRVECWGSTQVEAESVWKAALLALDAVAHGRAGVPGAETAQEGTLTAGNFGVKLNGFVVVRLLVAAQERPRNKPTSAAVIKAEVKNAAGQTPEEADLGT